jgi:phosphoribosylamine---glycine ligase
MNILLIGSGGREHALAWKLRQSPHCETLYCAPGNPGIADVAERVAIDAADHAAVIAFCTRYMIGLVVVGPEVPLVAGLADDLRKAGIPVFGPSKAAAQLEGSKGFTKDLCSAANIPTAAYERFTTAAGAIAGLDDFAPPYVIKADGLAAGKGVILAETRDHAEMVIADMFDAPGAALVIEDFMPGEEASFFAITDGTHIMPFGSAQDHKRVGDGDTGPNTGGMGAYSPAPVLTPALEAQVMAQIIEPTVAALAAASMPYCGVLFAGLMLTPDGPKLIEYNCRFGDPECQVLMLRYAGDLAALMLATATGNLASQPLAQFSANSALTVVIAARGYPADPVKGGAIKIAQSDAAIVFHAGTMLVDGKLVASGGRVLNAAAIAPTLGAAQTAAYACADAIDFADGFYRSDIGWREIARQKRQG